MALMGMARGGSSRGGQSSYGGGAYGGGGGGYGRAVLPGQARSDSARGGAYGGVGGGFGGGYAAPPGRAPTQVPPQMPTYSNAQVNMPKAQPYNSYQPGQAGQLNQNIDQLSQAGSGLMDPGSDYYQQLSQSMQRQIGEQSAAQQRSAALRGAYSGLGGGASPETMATTGDIAQGGLEAQGRAESGLALQAPQLGAGMLSSTFSPLMGLQQLGEQSRQFGSGLGEQQRQFGVNAAMQQQGLAGEQAWRQAQLQQQQQMAQQDAMMRQMAMMYGMF
jgi:hypothetical protein